MRLCYQYEEGNRGLIVLECQPQKRIMHFCEKKTYKPQNIFLCLPYIVFVVNYTKNKQGEFIYHGLSGNGLQVYFNNKPLTSLDDAMGFSPMDLAGYSCTDHRYDGAKYKDLKSLVSEVLGLWFGARQGICNSRWKRIKTIKSVLKLSWDGGEYYDEFPSLFEMMELTAKATGYNFYPKRKCKLQDKEW
jgi:hypothetical protein